MTPDATTTYVVFRWTEFDGVENAGWTEVGQYTVRAGRSDKAKQQALAHLAKEYPDTESFVLAAISARSWQPEQYDKTPPVEAPFKRRSS